MVSVIDEAISFNFNEVFTSMRFFSPSISRTIIKKIKKFKPGQTLEINIQRTLSIKELYPCKLNPLEWTDFFNANPSDDEVIKIILAFIFTGNDRGEV